MWKYRLSGTVYEDLWDEKRLFQMGHQFATVSVKHCMQWAAAETRGSNHGFY
jgi:hypothetical protein